MEATRVKEDAGTGHPVLGWRQGDCAVGRHSSFHVRAISALSSEPIGEGSGAGDNVGQDACDGFVVLSQSCDIVRPVDKIPFVQIAALVRVDADSLAEIRARRRLQYALVPGVEDQGLVADLGQVMSLSKEALPTLPRTVGCRDDDERRIFAAAIVRKFSRFAFPDDFVSYLEPLRRRLKKKQGKGSPEGQAVKSLYEIRVRAPSWNEPKVEVHFWFLWDETDGASAEVEWDKWCEKWLGLIGPSARYSITWAALGLEDLTARDYLDSDALDLEHLSGDVEE